LHQPKAAKEVLMIRRSWIVLFSGAVLGIAQFATAPAMAQARWGHADQPLPRQSYDMGGQDYDNYGQGYERMPPMRYGNEYGRDRSGSGRFGVRGDSGYDPGYERDVYGSPAGARYGNPGMWQ